MDGFDEKLKGMKEHRAKVKADVKKHRGEPTRPVYVQANSSVSDVRPHRFGRSGSVSSSDVESLVEQARQKEKEAEKVENEMGKDDEEAKNKETEAREADGKAEAARNT